MKLGRSVLSLQSIGQALERAYHTLQCHGPYVDLHDSILLRLHSQVAKALMLRLIQPCSLARCWSDNTVWPTQWPA